MKKARITVVIFSDSLCHCSICAADVVGRSCCWVGKSQVEVKSRAKGYPNLIRMLNYSTEKLSPSYICDSEKWSGWVRKNRKGLQKAYVQPESQQDEEKGETRGKERMIVTIPYAVHVRHSLSLSPRPTQVRSSDLSSHTSLKVQLKRNSEIGYKEGGYLWTTLTLCFELLYRSCRLRPPSPVTLDLSHMFLTYEHGLAPCFCLCTDSW